MCDYGDYEQISSKTVRTRKPHECGSCTKSFPAGSVMTYLVGKSEGEIQGQYACAACLFLVAQEDETPLHMCWGWGFDAGGYDRAEETYAYIKYCLENNEIPSVIGLKAVHDQYAALEEA